MKSLLAAVMLVLALPAFAQESAPEGTWHGAIQISGFDLRIIVTFARPGGVPAATIDIPQQSAKGLPLLNVRLAPPKVHFELQGGPGIAVFEGVRSADSVTGKFTQGAASGRFVLHAGSEPEEQAAVEPLPYNTEEVKFTNGVIELAGTLSLPPGGGRHPAVVMITGSGPQNRDEEIFGFKPFKVIADSLARRGIAVLRYDDRGVGGSSGNIATSTTADFAADALAGIRFLKNRTDIDSSTIGICGHSEGAAAAPIAAADSRGVAFLVLIAGPAVPGDSTILDQLITLSRQGGATEKEIADNVALERELFDALRTGKGWEEVKAGMLRQTAKSMRELTPEQRQAIADSAQFVTSIVEGKIQSVQSPWFKYFIMLDPALALRRVHCPVLSLFGELDMQVPPRLNRKPMEDALRAAGNTDATVTVIPGANHLFQKAVTGSPGEYAALPKQFVPGFLTTICDWVVQHAGEREHQTVRNQ